MIRVGLDVTPSIVSTTGVRRYADMVWRELSIREDVELRAFGAGRGAAPATGLPFRRMPVPLRVLHPLWRAIGRPRAETIVGPVDVVHSLALMPPPTRRPLVVTVHDVLAITHEQYWPPGAADERRALLTSLHPDVVVTTCEATADSISDVTGWARDRIVVAPLGALPYEGDPTPAPVDGPFMLAVGLITPRKGYAALAAAVSRLGPDAPPLLIAGPDWFAADEVRAAIRAADRHNKVRLLGAVEDATLQALYEHATIVCHPSVAEGFGMTCLEAMHVGAAVVAADIPSIREMGEGAVVLVPPADDEALAAALRELLDDESQRIALGALARARAAGYTWARTAAGAVAAYERAIR